MVFGCRPSPRHARRLAIASGLAAMVSGALTASPALAAATCTAQGLTVQPLQSSTFYIDTATSYLGSYVGYRVTNDLGSARERMWLRLEDFTGGVVVPATGAASTAPVPLETLAAGSATPGYAYLRASTPTASAQLHDVVLYEGRPGAGGVEICRETQTLTSVEDVIKAAANKVTSASVSSASATLGGTFDLTVTGATGVIGSGIAADPGVVRFSPAVAADWPSSAFRLVDVSHELPAGAAALPDVLSQSGMSGPDRKYSITYRFRVVGATSSPTPVVPVQNIASGTQVKHTDPDSLASLSPIPPVTSDATMAVSVGTAGPYTSGSTVPLSATITNDAPSPITVDEVVLRLPDTWSAVPGSAAVGGAAVADPHDAGGGELRLVGPFTIPASGSVPFTLQAVAGAPGTTGSFSAAGTLAGGQIDATTTAADDAPATLTLAVVGPPDAQADTFAVATGVATGLDVLANDRTGNSQGTLSIVTAPLHGVATVDGDRLSYQPHPGYTGGDTLTYRLTTASGSDDAAVTLNVADPPPAPAPASRTSTGVGTAVQATVVPHPADGTVSLLDANGLPAISATVAGQGTYVLDPATGTISWTPVLGFAGTATPVTFRVTDAFGQHGDADYTPTVTKPQAPAPAARSSRGTGVALQTVDLDPPAGTTVRLLDGTQSTSTVTVSGQGTYTLDTATGIVTFAPAFGFSGPALVTFRVTDAYGQTGEATYTATVDAPDAPQAEPTTSSGTATDSQRVTLSMPPGGSVVLMDGSSPTLSLTVPGEGTYSLDPVTGELTFAPVLGFSGTATPITYRMVDAYGQSVTATHTASVLKPPAPVASPADTSGTSGADQRVTIKIPAGGTATLLDANGVATTQVEIPGVGTYRLDPASGVITFSPAAGFGGTPTGVTYQLTDAYGQAQKARYTPTVVPSGQAQPAAPEPVADAPVAAGPARTCVSRRQMKINFKVARSAKLKRLTVTVNGKLVSRLSVRSRQAVVDMRGMPAQNVRIVITGRLRDGGRITATRTYRPCRPRLVHPPLPTLRLRPVR